MSRSLSSLLLRPRSRSADLAIGIACTLTATALRALLAPTLGSSAPWSTYVLGVLVASLLGGTSAAAAALVTSVPIGFYFFISPAQSFGGATFVGRASVAVFTVLATSVAGLGVTFRKMLQESERSASRLEREVRLRVEAERLLRNENEALSRVQADREALLRVAENARTAAEASNRAKDEFLAMLGHELRNPLGAIRNAVAVAILDGPSREKALAIAKRQTDQLGRLLDDLLDIARITRGRVTLQRERTALQPILQHAVESTRNLREARGQHLSVNLPSSDVYVDGDATRLEQVVVNLLSNAFNYTPPNGHIAISLTSEHDEAVVRVSDSGIGIEPEFLQGVFDLFAQAGRTLDRRQGGLGIGLTVAHQIVKLHEGSIEARSDGLGKGAEFIVRLRQCEAADRAVAPAREADRTTRSLRVLIVEDNHDAAESLRLLLELRGHRVRAALDGAEALEAARADRPDLILVDLGLPGMDGYEVARHMRSEATLRNVRIVALTGYGQPQDRRASLAAGFDDHLVKPVDAGELEGVVSIGRASSA